MRDLHRSHDHALGDARYSPSTIAARALAAAADVFVTLALGPNLNSYRASSVTEYTLDLRVG